MILTAPFQDKGLEFLVKIPLTSKHIFYKYVTRMSVGNNFATYRRRTTRFCFMAQLTNPKSF